MTPGMRDDPRRARVGPPPLRVAAGAVDYCIGFLEGLVEWLCAGLLILTVAVTITQVFFRYVLNASLSWPEEMARWSFVWLVFLGGAVAVWRDKHIAVDLLAKRLPARLLPWHRALAGGLIGAASLALLDHGLDLARRATYVSPALGWHFRYLYLAVPCGAALTLLMLARPRSVTNAAVLAATARLAIALGLYLALAPAAQYLHGLWDTWVVLVVAALVLILASLPVGFSLVFATLLAFYPQGDLMLLTVSQNLTSALDSFILLAIPFFILAAGVMNEGGITDRLVTLATRLVGHLRGGLGHVNVVTNTLMAGLSGSSMADAAAIAKTMAPAMEQRGYTRSFCCAVTASSSVLANLIPPSMSLIIFGALASLSVGTLFVATIVPGLMMAAALLVVVHILSLRRGYGRDIDRATWGQRRQAFSAALPALILPIAIVGGVRFGAFTASEAGAMAVLYALVVALVFYRQLGLGAILMVREAVMDTIAVMFVVAAASPFAWVLVTEQVPQHIAAGIGGLSDRPVLLLMAINVFLLVVGLFMELIAALVILVPIFIPIVTAAGIDPIHFGIIMVCNLVLGALTPPLGMLVFTTARVTQTSVMEVFRAVLPFLIAQIAVLAAITYIPALSLALPGWIGP